MTASSKPGAMSRQPRHYDAPARLRTDVPGVQYRQVNEHTDQYTGTAEALVSAGLATVGMFPGQPGVPSTCVTYRPRGATVKMVFTRDRTFEESWAYLSGSLTISRRSGGLFCARLVVSKEEQARRFAEAEAKQAQQRAVTAQQRAVTAQYPSNWPFERLTPGDWHRVLTPANRQAVEDFALRLHRGRGKALCAELMAEDAACRSQIPVKPQSGGHLALVWSEGADLRNAS